MKIIEDNINQIIDLCQKHRVARLYAFGSVLKNDFKPSSDIDLLVDFNKIPLKDYADNYFSLKDALENLLNRKIDLLENTAIKNPYLRSSIDSSKVSLYG